MEQIRFSDLDTTMVAKRTFDYLLEQIQSSNLNFHLSQSFLVLISLKKYLVKDKYGKILLPPCPASPNLPKQLQDHEQTRLLDENHHLKLEVESLKVSFISSKESIQILDQKISKMEASDFKSVEERSVEISTLKKLVESANGENESYRKELKAINKIVKEKD